MDNTEKKKVEKKDTNIIETKGRFQIIREIPKQSTTFSMKHIRELAKKKKKEQDTKQPDNSWKNRESKNNKNNSVYR